MKLLSMLVGCYFLAININAEESYRTGTTKVVKKINTQTAKVPSDEVVSGAKNPDVNCIDKNGKTLTKEDKRYELCQKEMKVLIK